MKMKVIIDRFEGNYAVVEIDQGQFVNLPKELVPNAKEGDIIIISVDHDEAKRRKEHVKELMNQLFED